MICTSVSGSQFYLIMMNTSFILVWKEVPVYSSALQKTCFAFINIVQTLKLLGKKWR